MCLRTSTSGKILRLKGWMLMRQGRCTEAEAQLRASIECSRRQKAKSWELRAAMSLARLWRDQGKVQQARELLVPIYGWFTEGFETADLEQAKALLMGS